MTDRSLWVTSSWVVPGGRTGRRTDVSDAILYRQKNAFEHVSAVLQAQEAELAERGGALVAWLSAQLPNVRDVAKSQLVAFLEEAPVSQTFLVVLEVLSRCDLRVAERIVAKALTARPLSSAHLHALAIARADNVVLASGELGQAVLVLLDAARDLVDIELRTDLTVDGLATLAKCEPSLVLDSAGAYVADLTGFEQTRALEAMLVACRARASTTAPSVSAALDSRWNALVTQVTSGVAVAGDVPGVMARLLEVFRRTRVPSVFQARLAEIEDSPIEVRVLYQFLPIVRNLPDVSLTPIRARCLRLLRATKQYSAYGRAIEALAPVDPNAIQAALDQP